MKSALLAVLVALALALTFVLLYRSKAEPQAPLEVRASVFPAEEVSLRRPLPAVAPGAAPQTGDAAILARLDRLLERMDALEAQVARIVTAPRRSLKEEPLPASRFDDQDLETLKAIQREVHSGRGREVLREELVAEAWCARQEELAATARHLGKELALAVELMDPLVAVLCADGRRFFELERRLADEDHGLETAARLGREFRSARVRLAKDLGRVILDEVLAARIFLYVVSKGDERSLTLAPDETLELQRDWLR